MASPRRSYAFFGCKVARGDRVTLPTEGERTLVLKQAALSNPIIGSTSLLIHTKSQTAPLVLCTLRPGCEQSYITAVLDEDDGAVLEIIDGGADAVHVCGIWLNRDHLLMRRDQDEFSDDEECGVSLQTANNSNESEGDASDESDSLSELDDESCEVAEGSELGTDDETIDDSGKERPSPEAISGRAHPKGQGGGLTSSELAGRKEVASKDLGKKIALEHSDDAAEEHDDGLGSESEMDRDAVIGSDVEGNNTTEEAESEQDIDDLAEQDNVDAVQPVAAATQRLQRAASSAGHSTLGGKGGFGSGSDGKDGFLPSKGKGGFRPSKGKGGFRPGKGGYSHAKGKGGNFNPGKGKGKGKGGRGRGGRGGYGRGGAQR